MSSLIVEVVNIDNIQEHPNADRLELATIKGWQCVVRKNDFNKGNRVVYIPIDSVLPVQLEERIFGPDSKVKLSKSRVKTIKLRGAISQGLVIGLDTAGIDTATPVGTDVRVKLGIVKWEPPVRYQRSIMSGAKAKKTNDNFKKYTSIENVKNYINLFKECEMVSVTEKIHGSNFRAGYVPRRCDTLWKKILKFLGILSKYEFVYGSHNVQLQNSIDITADSTNIYLEAVKRDRLTEKLKPGEVIYGEIYGSGVQKNYMYDCINNERKTVYFDAMIDGKYLGTSDFSEWCIKKGLRQVPYVYHGPYNYDRIKKVLTGNSVMCSSQKTIEGGVCKPMVESSSIVGRKILKFINDDYLLKDNTEFH